MEKCLVTKLKEVVDNGNLTPLGGFYVSFKAQATPNANSRLIRIAKTTDDDVVTLSIVEGDGYFTDSTFSQNKGKTVTVQAGVDVYVSNHACKVLIQNKYAIRVFSNMNNPATDVIGVDINGMYKMGIADSTQYALELYLRGSGVYGDISTFNGRTINNIDVRSSRISGNISDILFSAGTSSYDVIAFEDANISGTLNVENGRLGDLNLKGTSVAITTGQVGTMSLTSLNLRGDLNATGDIADIADGNSSITGITIYGTSITGTLESLLEAYWAAPHSKRDGTIVVQMPSGCTLNGNTYTTNMYCIFSSSSIVVKNNSSSGEVLATYDGSDWTY